MGIGKTIIYLTGDFSREVYCNWRFWYQRWLLLRTMPLKPLPPPKVFKPKHEKIWVLDDYGQAPPDGFWFSFPSNLVQPARSAVDHVKLRLAAVEAGFSNKEVLEAVCRDLEFGALIGCRPDFRHPTVATNARSAIESGRQVTDALADWVTKGFVYGPVPKGEVPKHAKFSGLMVRPKPNGSVRVICNLSAPKDESVNDGIDKDDFPTSMDTLDKWLRALKAAGRECNICKVDWSDAYKHVAVALEDTDLQWFEWLDQCFKELCLIFGGKSSAGIYDRLAKVVLFVVIFRSGIDKKAVIQFLDDCCAAAPKGSSILDTFDRVFAEVAQELGVRLAPRDDPDKSFAPRTYGTVLGIHYDTVAWTWALPEEKLLRLLHLLRELLQVDETSQGQIMTMAGKVLNIAPLVPSGKYNLDCIIRANALSQDKTLTVAVPSSLKKQMAFWFDMLRLCSGTAAIPDPPLGLPAWAFDVYTDAAGGSSVSPGLGAGAVARGFWAFVPWSHAINVGKLSPDGRRLDRAMSALELVGPLLALVAGSSIWRGHCVRFWVDNSGSVFIFRKGYSTSCRLSTTLVRAIATVAAGIGCRVDVVKISRCSTVQADMADALSKSDLTRFWANADKLPALALPLSPAVVPPALTAWLAAPSEDAALGERLLSGLVSSGAPSLGSAAF